jgi:hypothetical protein
MDVSKQNFINVCFVVFGAIRLVWQGGGHHQLMMIFLCDVVDPTFPLRDFVYD